MKIFIAASFLSMLFSAFVAAQPGSLDTSFAGGDGKVSYTNPAGGIPDDIALQSDGKIILLAGPTQNSLISLMRLNLDGSLDTSLNGTGIRTFNWGLNYKRNHILGKAWTMAIQNVSGTERIVIAGKDPKVVGNSVQDFIRLDRFMPDGATDTSFGTNGTVFLSAGLAYDIAIQSDQKIVGVSQQSNKIFRLNANGTPDNSFGSGGMITGSGTLQRLTLAADGSILVTSTVTIGSGKNANMNIEVRKYSTNGSLDLAFGTNGSAKFGRLDYDFVPKSITVDSLHNILLGSRSWTPDRDIAAVRFTQNGLVDTSFADNGLYLAGYSALDARPAGALIGGDGKIYLIGNFHLSSPKDAVVIRLNHDGSLDGGFGSSGISTFDIYGDDYVDIGPGGVIQSDPFCSCEKLIVVSSHSSFTSFARLNTQ